MDEGKICTKCNQYKYLYDYDKNKTKPMGVKSACKECNKPYQKLHYQNNKDKYKQAFQDFMKRNPDYFKNYCIL